MAITNTTTSVINIVRGLIHDIIRTDGRDSFTYTSSNVFNITEDYISYETISVFQNGTELSSNDYSYNSDNNQVTITASLSANDTILITYSYYKKYSDNELKEYLESALAYFPQYKYKKTFIINDVDKIVAINGFTPTEEELYFIATITSILVDPQNVKINIPDLNISANRDKSDIEQIKEAFRNFKQFVGTINFEEYVNLSD